MATAEKTRQEGDEFTIIVEGCFDTQLRATNASRLSLITHFPKVELW